jgi:anthranilate synthase component 1
MDATVRADFDAAVGRGNTIIPVVRTLQLDRETPVSLFLRFPTRAFFLLESAALGDASGRYSFIGLDRWWRVSAFRGQPVVDGIDIDTSGSPLAVVRRLLAQFHCEPITSLPDFFGGAVGYITYDYVRNLEDLPGHDGDPSWPDVDLSAPRMMLIVDHFRHTTTIVALAEVDGFDDAVARISEVADELVSAPPASDLAIERLIVNAPNMSNDFDVRGLAAEMSNTNEAQYGEIVARAQQHILAGDIFQVVPSQQFSRPSTVDPFTLYRVLRALNPSPYMYFLSTPDGHVVGASPEMLVRVADGVVSTRPIAGTRRRGASAHEDEVIAAGLLRDEKEIAEHVMLVDLGRNDLGKVAKPGSVSVERLAHIERFSHLMHIVSDVSATLREDCDAIDAFNATFPAGTLTGAPKIRAMELIDSFEQVYRATYGGALGYFSFTGSADFAITIRTLALRNGTVTIQAGGGVVADSTGSGEYNECITKASAPLLALLIAESV